MSETHEARDREASRNRLIEALNERRPSLLRYLKTRMSDPSEVQDVAQETYIKLMTIKRPEQVENPASYLFRIAANVAADFQRKKNRFGDTIDLESASEKGLDTDGNAFARTMETRDELKELQTILEDLSPLYQSVLLLRKRDGYSHDEIAEKLNISKHTVHKYLKRALLACRQARMDK